MKGWIRGLLAVLFLLAVLAGANWVLRLYRTPGSMTVLESQAMDMRSMKPPTGLMPVATAHVESGPFVPTITYSGTVVAQGDQEIAARVTGVVEEVPVYPGDHVLPGQLLVRLDSEELSSRVEEAVAGQAESEDRLRARQAESRTSLANLHSDQVGVAVTETQVAEARELSRAAQVELERVRAEYARSRSLHSQGAISVEDLQRDRSRLAEAQAGYDTSRLRTQRALLEVSRAHAQLKASQGQIEESQRNIDVAQAGLQGSLARLRTAEVSLSYTRILATMPAEVVERVASPGTLVTPGQVLLRLKQAGRVRLQALIPVEQALSIRKGFPVKAKVADRLIQARVDSIFRSADPQTRTLVVEALVESQPDLVPGTYLTMEITVAPPLRRLSIPLAALQKDAEGQPFVWKIESGKPGSRLYTCVMHPEVRLPDPGLCPKCGMNLVPEKPMGDTVARRQKISPGPQAAQRVAIQEGLTAGDEVVVEGYQDLADGMAVKSVRWGQDGPLDLPVPKPQPVQPVHKGGSHGNH